MSRPGYGNLSSIGSRNVIVIGLAVALIIALILLPEIIRFRITVPNSRVAKIVREDEQEKNVSKKSGESPLDKIAALLEGKKYPSASAELDRQAPNVEDISITKRIKESLNLTPKFLRKDIRKAKEDAAVKEEENADIKKPLTWNMYNSGQYSELLLGTQKRTLLLASRLDGDFVRSKQALISVSNAIEFLLNGPRNVMTPHEGLVYIDNLMLKATRTLEEDGVNRRVYLSWRDIKLDAARALDGLSGKLGGERVGPKVGLVLTEIKLQYGSKIIKLQVKGAALGEEIKAVHIYRNGEFWGKGIFRGRVGKGAGKKFWFRSNDPTGSWLIRVIGKYDKYTQRRYVFMRGPIPKNVRFKKHTVYLLKKDPT